MKIVIRIRKSSSLHTLTHTLTRMGNNKNNGIYQRNDMKKRCFSLFPVVKKNEKQRFRLCKKISVNSTTVIKNDIVERLEKQPLNFFTVYNKYRNLSSSSTVSLLSFRYAPFQQTDRAGSAQSVGVHDLQLAKNSAPVLSGIVHFFVISWVARYKAFKSAVSLENTLLCLFRRR